MRHDVSQALGRAMTLENLDAAERDDLMRQYASARSLNELPDWIASLAEPDVP